MNREKLLLIGLLFLICIAAACQTVQSQQNSTATATSYVTSNQVSTVAVGTQVVTSTSGQTTPIFSGNATIPGTHGVCGIYFVHEFNGTAGNVITGSIAASSSVDVYVMTSAVYQSWSHQVVAGGICTPPSLVVSQKNTTSYSLTGTLPATGVYDLVINNLSRSIITVQINAALTASSPSLVTETEYSTETQPMVQTLVVTSVQTLQSAAQPSTSGPGTTTLAAAAIVIVIVVAIAAYLAKSKRGTAGKK